MILQECLKHGNVYNLTSDAFTGYCSAWDSMLSVWLSNWEGMKYRREGTEDKPHFIVNAV